MIHKKIYLVFYLTFLLNITLYAQINYKHQVGIDPGTLIQLFDDNQNLQGINYKYNFYKTYLIRLGGYASFSNNNGRTIAHEIRIGLEKEGLFKKHGSAFYGLDCVRYKTSFDDRSQYILKKKIELLFGLKLHTVKSLAISIDYRIPLEWTSYSSSQSIVSSNIDEFQVSLGESINFMIIFQF